MEQLTATLHVASAGAIRRGIDAVCALAQRGAGVDIATRYASAPKVVSWLAGGEHADVVVVPDASQEKLAAAGLIDAATRFAVGRSGMAVVVKRGVAAPGIATAEALKAALLAAEAVVHNEGSSGAAAAAMIDRLGIREALGARLAVVENSAVMMDRVVNGRTVIGLAQATNARDHVARGTAIAIAGPFPGTLQHVTTYEAAVTRGCCNRAAAEAFMQALRSAEGRACMKDAGLE